MVSEDKDGQKGLKPDKNYIKFGVSSKSLEGLNGNAGAIYLYKGSDELKVYLYKDENWQGDKEEITGKAGECVTPPSFTAAKSIELNWQNPGVYLCKDKEGKICSVYSSSQPRLADGFDDKVVSIRFKNPYAYDSSLTQSQCQTKGGTYFTVDNQNKPLEKPTCAYETQKYGAILHEKENYQDTCKEFFSGYGTTTFPISLGSTNNFPGPSGVSSITVFLQPNPGETPEGKGATLYEDIDYQAGQITLPRTGDTLVDGKYEYSNFNIINWDNKAENIKDKVSSIKIDGNYMALLFHQTDYHGRCEVFRDDDPNLNKKTGNSIDENNAESAKVIIIKK